MSALIQANGLHRFYGTTHAVNDVSIELQQGEILGLLGPNGAGKSSCLQMLCGVLAPSAGEININGADLFDQPNLAKQNIGYLPDTPPLYAELTVNEYLLYAARLRRVKKSQLIAFREKGFQQRVGIAQAIIHQPNVIILDEPTVGLDPIQMIEIRKLILELGEQHGIILSTHILPEVQAVCNRVQVIHRGQSVFNKKISELKNTTQVELRLQTNIDIESLNALPGVQLAEIISSQHYLLSGENIQASLADISQYCVDKNWGLLELSQKENTLEQIFINLTAGEYIISKNNAEDVA